MGNRHFWNRRAFLQVGAAAMARASTGRLPAAQAGEPLYNGIALPALFPPKRPASIEPMPVPYLLVPPAVIPIDVGRQLFVDDFLIEQTTLQRTFHATTYHPATPVLKPDKPWEQTAPNPTAMPFSDGVWYDPKDRLFKMWYMGGYTAATCYATSTDGIRWDKPELDVKPGTNIVIPQRRDSTTVWLDLEEKDPARRYKFFSYDFGGGMGIAFSADGIHWKNAGRASSTGDRTTVFYNPFRKVWVYGIRGGSGPYPRIRLYREHAEVLEGAKWKAGEPVFWVNADKLDPQREDLKVQPQLYNLDCIAYESVLLGLFTIWRGQPRDRAKPNELCAGFSRDGFHWHRPERRALISVSEQPGAWNWGNVQSAGGGCLVVGDQLYFYVSGRAGIKGSTASGVSSTGLAVLRRDGFASMDAGRNEGTLTTRPLAFRGKHFFVNLDAEQGELRVEALDEKGQVRTPFSRANCVPVRGNRTLQGVQWQGATDLGVLAGKPIQFRFYLTNGRLYAFWISPESSGASHGYVGAGGPGYLEATDTVGTKAQRN